MFNNVLTFASGITTDVSRKASTNPTIGVFKSADGSKILEIRQKQTRARKRHEFVLTVRKIAADPLTAVNAEVSMSAGFYVDRPKVGFADSEVTPLFVSIKDFLNASTNLAQLVSEDN